MKQLIKKIVKEEMEKMSPLETMVAEFIEMDLNYYDLPEGFYKIAVDIFPDNYGRQECAITALFKKSFTMKDSDKMHLLMNKIKNDINVYFGGLFSHISNGTSTEDVYNDTKDWYDKKKNK